MPRLNQIFTPRLVVYGLIVALSLMLSGVTFYYFHANAPIIPLVIGLIAALPLGMIIDEMRHLLKTRKTQQPHQPPKRS